MDWIKDTYKLELVKVNRGFDASPRNEYFIKTYDVNKKESGVIPTASSLNKVKGHMRTLATRIELETDHLCELDFKGPVISGKISHEEDINRIAERRKKIRIRRKSGR